MSAFDLQIQEDGLGVLTFDRPGEKVNTFSREVFEEFAEVLLRLGRDRRGAAGDRGDLRHELRAHA